MQVLITGATGLLGNNLARMLLDQGEKVRVLVRPPVERRELDGLDLEKIEGDIGDSDAIHTALENVDLVVHAAAMINIGWSKLEESRRINVEGTRRVATLARQKNIRMIHVSAVNALAAGRKNYSANESDTEPCIVSCAYIVSKREADAVVLENVAQGLNASIVYPSLIFGSWDWKPSSGQMILPIANGFVPFSPRGGISTADVADVCRGILLAAEKGKSGERYILAGHNITYLDLWRRIAKSLRRRGPICKLGPIVNWSVGHVADLINRFKENEGVINSAGMRLSNHFNYYNSDKAIEQLGYRISPLEPALDRAVDFLARQKLIDNRKTAS
jgi:dihydroflavonol-4-reductase